MSDPGGEGRVRKSVLDQLGDIWDLVGDWVASGAVGYWVGRGFEKTEKALKKRRKGIEKRRKKAERRKGRPQEEEEE